MYGFCSRERMNSLEGLFPVWVWMWRAQNLTTENFLGHRWHLKSWPVCLRMCSSSACCLSNLLGQNSHYSKTDIVTIKHVLPWSHYHNQGVPEGRWNGTDGKPALTCFFPSVFVDLFREGKEKLKVKGNKTLACWPASRPSHVLLRKVEYCRYIFFHSDYTWIGFSWKAMCWSNCDLHL